MHKIIIISLFSVISFEKIITIGNVKRRWPLTIVRHAALIAVVQARQFVTQFDVTTDHYPVKIQSKSSKIFINYKLQTAFALFIAVT